jgi:hypothetical protein
MAEEEKKLQTFLPDPFRFIPAAIGEAGKDLADLGSDALELVYGKERTDKIEGALSSALNFIDDTLDKTAVGKATTQALEKTFYPKDLNVAEEIGKEIGSYLVPGTAASKLLKAKKATTRLGKFARYGTAGVIADVIAKDEDEQYLKEMMDLASLKGKSKEVDELVAKLDINPDDTVSERLLKQLIDSTGLAVTVGIPTSLALGLFKFGGSKAIGKFKAIKKDKITTPVTNTADNVASNVEVVQQSPGQFLQRGKLISAVGKINTQLGRALRSKASMPDKVFKAYIRKNKYAEGKELLVKQGAKDLEQAIKNQTKGLDDAAKEVVRTDVNKVLQGQTPVGQLSQELTDVIKRLRRNIDIQSTNLKNILNLSDRNKLGIAIDKNLNSYITKSYEFYTNPAWAKKLKKGLRGNLDNINDADTIDRINDMRAYLQDINPTLTSSQIDGVLDKFIDGVTQKTSGQYDTLSGIMGFSAGGKPIKIFKQRKQLDDRLINFLGEVKDPYRNYIETMRNLNKGIAKAQYFKDIKKFADENLGQEIKLGSLIPYIGIGKFKIDLPTASTKVLKESQIGLTQNIGDLVAKEMGALGGSGKAFGLNKYMTTDLFAKMIDKGIDTFDTNMAVGGGFVNALKRTTQRAAGVTQAAETVFDHTAHMVNLYGMFQTLATNGHIFAGKEAAKAAKTIYQKAFLKKDPEALKFFAKAKEKGVVDSSVNAEIVRRNLDVFDENLAESGLKRGLRKAGRIPSEIYGLTDDFGKLTALQVEIKSYQKALNLTDDEAFDYAAEIVRNTMPSYTTAIPLVRAVAKTPLFGTYATFPAEILRSNFNILKYGLRDLKRGIATGNIDLAKIGLRRLSGAAATTLGIDYAFNRNNEDEYTGMGVTKESQKGINQLVSDWQKNTSKNYTSPIYEDSQGKIRTSFVDSGSLDANQYTKNIVKGVLGTVFAGGDVSETELEDRFINATREIYSPFISEKFLFGAVLNMYRGRDENGREISNKEAMQDIAKVFVPGTFKSAYRLYEAADAEEKAKYDGLPIASNKRGYPIKFEDEFQHFYSGIRNSNMDVTKSVGTFIYNENQKLKQPIKKFMSDLRGYDSKVYTQADIDNIVDMYLDSQLEKKKLMRQFSDRLNTIKNIQYYSKQGSNVVKKRFGIEKIIEANTGMGRKKIDDSVLYALQDGEDGAGFFMPDNVLNDNTIMTILKDKRFPPELIKQLAAVQSQITGARLRDE